jgi:translin
MRTLKTVFNGLKKELRDKDKVRESIQQNLRKATASSKQAILLVHQKRLNEAEEQVEKAKEILAGLKDASGAHPDLIYCGMYNAALQEYSEANVFLKLVKESRYMTPGEICSSSADYVLGLADVIGELRRLALDALREGDLKKGENCLQTMDEIYIELMAMDESYMLVPGLRRKCDIARKIIETTRGDITQEIRRSALEKHLKQFEKYVKEAKTSSRK